MRWSAGCLIVFSLSWSATSAPAEASAAVTPLAPFAVPVGQAKCEGIEGYASTSGGTRNFLWRPEWLAVQKAEIARDPIRARVLRRAADKALGRGPYSVRHKIESVTIGGPGDYISIGPYWWPNPETSNGLPYVRRDGEINPERDGDRFDSRRLSSMSNDVVLLSLAASHLGERRYADHAARLVRAWFVDPASRMNPNLKYAQAVPGLSAGRSFGIIDAVEFIDIIESVGLLEASGALTPSDDAALRAWFAELARWMETSDNGKSALATTNNHGLYFDLMLAHFSLFAGTDIVARHLVETYPDRRLIPQIDTAGRLPKELARTRPWSYSVFALKAALRMAMLGECLGVDLWTWRAADGRGLRLAVDHLLPYREKLKRWPYPDKDLRDQELNPRAWREADHLFRLASWGWRDPTIANKHPAPTDDYILPDYQP